MTTSSSRLNPESISSLDEGLRRRYSERFQRLGADPRALGWDTRENQRARFATAVRSINFRDKSVLDIGCGLADFHDFLAENPETRARHYTGFDINEDFIEHCRRRLPDSAFEQRNVLTDPPDGLRWDIVTAFGVLNLRLADIDNRVFARAMMESAFAQLVTLSSGS
jgi:SAM-dependent methyltransferase